MDSGFDQNGWKSDPASSVRGPKTAPPEWHGLRRRLSAARAMRHTLAAEPLVAEAVPAGSFDRLSARVLADYGHLLTAVNATFWADGKLNWLMGSAVPGETSPGDRE